MRSSVGVKLTILALSVLSVFLASCTETADTDASGTLVTITSLQGVSAGGAGQQDPLFSDICINESGVFFPAACTILADQAAVTMIARNKNLISPFQPGGPYHDVIFDRYRVTYIRADGRKTPGVDVPYPFDGAMNLYIPIGEEGGANFIVVREQAKSEPPLVNLAGNGGAIVLST